LQCCVLLVCSVNDRMREQTGVGADYFGDDQLQQQSDSSGKL
jgi:hypothetical protein